MFETRKTEHKSRVCIKKKDLKDGNIESVKERMGNKNRKIARHSTQSSKDIDWKKI